jgi:hypothetical protein
MNGGRDIGHCADHSVVDSGATRPVIVLTPFTLTRQKDEAQAAHLRSNNLTNMY